MTLFENPTISTDPKVREFIGKITGGIGEGWQSLLGDTFNSHSFYNIIDLLFSKAKKGEKIYPKSTEMFKAFRECKYSKLKVVFIGQDPYHQPGVADGMAFSCGLSKKEQPSLKLIFDEITRTVGDNSRDPDLTRWANQGILLLNTALSVKERTADSHTDLWRPFIVEFLQMMNEKQRGIIYVFFGSKAKELSYLISDQHNTKINVVHPASAAYKGGQWSSNNLFNNINSLLKASGSDEITW